MKKKTWRDEEKNTHRVKHSHLNICIIIVHNTFITGLKLRWFAWILSEIPNEEMNPICSMSNYSLKRLERKFGAITISNCVFCPIQMILLFGCADVMCRLKTVFLLIRLFLSDGVLFELLIQMLSLVLYMTDSNNRMGKSHLNKFHLKMMFGWHFARSIV